MFDSNTKVLNTDNDVTSLMVFVTMLCNFFRPTVESEFVHLSKEECEEAKQTAEARAAAASAAAPSAAAAKAAEVEAVAAEEAPAAPATKVEAVAAAEAPAAPATKVEAVVAAEAPAAPATKVEAVAAAEAAAKVEAPAAEAAAKVEASAAAPSASAAAESAAEAKVALIQFFLIECSEDISTWLMNFIKRTPDFLKSVSMKSISDLTAATEATAAKKVSKVAEVAAEVAGKLAKEGQLSDEVAKDLKVAAEAAAAKAAEVEAVAAAKVEAGAAKKLTHLQRMGRPKGVSRKLKRPLRDQPPGISSSSLTNYQFSKSSKKAEYTHPEGLPNEKDQVVLDFTYSK
jgi:hypothetical protein